MIARSLIVASSGIILTLGVAHLIITFYGPKLRPRDADLQARLETVSPIITSETTMWRAWIGFNASHSFGAILFGAVYGYLAMTHAALLFDSYFLAGLGGSLLLGYLVLGKLYWFRVPFRAIALASACYAAGFILARL